MVEMEIHEAANIFPLEEETIPELAADIKANKQIVAIETLDGKIIDGRRRYRACKLAGVSPMVRAIHATDPVAYVLSLNLHRRQLTPSQRSMIAARSKEVDAKLAKDRQKASGGDKRSPEAKSVTDHGREPVEKQAERRHCGEANEHAGKRVGVSGKSVERATTVIEQGVPELIKAVDEGDISVRQAATIAKADAETQKEVVEAVKEMKATGEKKPVEPKKEADDERTLQGVGVFRANEAINSLSRIPKNDALRKRGFQIVTDWIKRNQ